MGTENEIEVTSQTNLRYTLTNGKLTFARPDPDSDAGKYQCVAENTVGSIIGPPVVVTAGYLKEFVNLKPGAVRAKLFQGTYITCNTPNFNPKVYYQWYKNDIAHFIRPTLNPHTFISENGRVYISEVQKSDEGEYHCIVTLTAPYGEKLATTQPPSRNSLGIGLIVEGENANDYGPDIHDDFPAVFPSPPERGREIRIECFAYGKLPLYYSWQKVNGSLPLGVRFENLNRVLVIPRARLEDSGVYRCHVKRGGAAATKDISVTIASRPYFLFPLMDKYIDMNSQLTLRCEAVAVPRATYTWYKNSLPLMSLPGDVEIYRNTLIIRQANPERHNGMYQCMAENRYGKTLSGAELKVLRFKPSFDKYPLSDALMGTVNGNITIKCLPEAAPTPEVKWSHNGSPLGLSFGASGRLTLLLSGFLVISQLTQSDEGSYTCTATNSEGTASSTGHLSVVGHTVLNVKPSNTDVIVNETAFMFCEASYDVTRVDVVYIWLFEDRIINIDQDPHFVQGIRGGGRGLYIRNAQYKHAGQYTCMAQTAQKHVDAGASLRVYGPPDEPAGVFAYHFRGQDVDLRWTPPLVTDPHAEPVTQYRVEVANNYDGWDSWEVVADSLTDIQTYLEEDPSKRSTTITGLGPGTNYRFRVIARNRFGWGVHSLPSKTYNQNPGPPSSAPPRVGGGGGSVGEITIEWDPILDKDHGGRDVGFHYRVFYRKMTASRDGVWLTSYVKACETEAYGGKVEGCETQHVGIVGLHNYYLQYETMVQGVNDLGEGPNSTIAIIYSAEEMPVTVPTNIYSYAVNATAIMVQWDAIPNTREIMKGKIQGYQINWWLDDKNHTYARAKYIRHYGNVTQGIVIGLQHVTDYWVNVQVYNGAGLSNPSENYWVSTYYNPPQHYPFHVAVRSHGVDSIYLTWRGISTGQDEESITGYTVRYWQMKNPMSSAIDKVVGKTFYAVLSNLEKNTTYQVRVIATSLGGDGKKSPTVYFTLGGQIRLNILTTEILASANKFKISISALVLCLVITF
ncbi:contactin-like [Gigantopelta aegis]|uniref:contactin-like n=1 Tax=Gigantopelta aegis TaxID=1735272 RepID=UPI001B88CBA4|nr:contactin-like [Gigantopelta aegis]